MSSSEVLHHNDCRVSVRGVSVHGFPDRCQDEVDDGIRVVFNAPCVRHAVAIARRTPNTSSASARVGLSRSGRDERYIGSVCSIGVLQFVGWTMLARIPNGARSIAMS